MSLDKHLVSNDDELLFERQVIIYSGADELLLFGGPFSLVFGTPSTQISLWKPFLCISYYTRLTGFAGRRAFPSTLLSKRINHFGIKHSQCQNYELLTYVSHSH